LIELEIKSELAQKKELIENERRRTYERFITMIVHEIKTPLSTIQIAAASLQRHLSENTLELKRITHIQESVVDINQVFNKCLQVVDIENGAVMIQTSAFGIPVLIEDLKRVLNSQRIVYEVQTSQKINTDYVILKTILLNLLSNAVKYAKPDTTIVCTLEEKHATDGKNQLLFKVRNEIGPIGSPDPDLTFTRHYRSESAKKHAGTGLGLWLSKELAASINASIHLSNSDTETCFDVYLNID
jgi:two-component system sensor histidine kinase KdpD